MLICIICFNLCFHWPWKAPLEEWSIKIHVYIFLLLKCYYDQILDTHFFTFSYTTGLSKISCQISIYYEQYNSCFLGLYFREFTATIKFPCSKSGLRIGENDVIFSNSQPRLGTRKINGGLKFSERKVQKRWVLLFVTDWNLARYLGHTYCVRKCKKNGYREFDHSSTLILQCRC